MILSHGSCKSNGHQVQEIKRNMHTGASLWKCPTPKTKKKKHSKVVTEKKKDYQRKHKTDSRFQRWWWKTEVWIMISLYWRENNCQPRILPQKDSSQNQGKSYCIFKQRKTENLSPADPQIRKFLRMYFRLPQIILNKAKLAELY